jgi:hypothetical protein
VPASIAAADLAYWGLIFPCLVLLGIAFARWNDARLYGRFYATAIRATRSAASGGKSIFLWEGRFLIFSALLLPLLLPAIDHERSTMSLSELAPVIAFMSLSLLAVGLATIRRVTAPPGVLILGASASLAGRQLYDLLRMRMRTRGHRVVFFLDARALYRAKAGRSLNLEEADREFFGNMYQSRHDDWEELVVPLIHLAPVLVVDASILSDGLVAEIDRIAATPQLAQKTIVFCGPRHALDRDAIPERWPSLRDHLANEPQRVVEFVHQLLWYHRNAHSRPQHQSAFERGMRIERNPHLPLVMDCPKTAKTFRLGVNSAVWEDSEGGKTRCPICGDWHEFSRRNTRSVSFEQAEKFPCA